MKHATEKVAQKFSKYFVDKPIVKACLFGSYARGEERRGSDVAVLVEMGKVNNIDIFDRVQLEE